ncbi:MAG: efflux transporter outer membrane subunit [Parachlamydiales bacterium]|jgi:multidrug efflux system outer membrane protein
MQKNTLSFALFLTILFLTGCSFEKAYTPPSVELCDQWKTDNSACEEQPCHEPLPIFWWKIFDDERLDTLECQALAANPDLKSAAANLQRAAASARIQYAALFPNVILNPSLYHAGTRVPSFFGIPAVDSPGRIQERIYNFPFSASYDLDLWGQYRMNFNAAEATAEAAYHQLRNTWLILTIQVAKSYYRIRAYDDQLQVIEKTLTSRKKAVDLNQERYDKGLSNLLDVSRSKVEFDNVLVQKDNLIQARGIEENTLAELTGLAASCFCVGDSPLYEEPPCVPLELPSTVLQQRPDLAEAERRLYAAQQNIGVAETAYLPSIALTGQIGYSSSIFNQLFDWESRFWSYGVQIAQLIFDAGATTAQVDEAVSVFLQRVADFEKIVVKAFKEVENALVNERAANDKIIHLERAVEDSAQTFKLSNNRYNAGLTNYLDVVDAERTLLNAELSLAQAKGERYTALLSLIEAMGGSW